MKRNCLLILLLINSLVHAQVITTVAGNGTYGYTGDGGPAVNALLADLYYTYPAFDNAGNMYIAQNLNNTIRKIDPSGIITTIAGTNGIIGYSGDGGPAVNALLYHPTSIAVDNANNIFFADRNGDIIRKIDPSGVITTVSGQYTTGCSIGDGGPLSSARFNTISAMTFDRAGNLYISDFGCNTIRKVNTAGIITTIAGNGTLGFSGDGGPATSAQMAYPCKVAVDNLGNIYVPDAENHRIRKIDQAGIITTIAGTGTMGYSGDGGLATAARIAFPGAVVIDNAGNLYFGDYNNVIRRIDPAGIISTYAGNGITGYTGDGGPALLAELSMTEGRISIDNNDNIYFADANDPVIRKITNCNVVTITQSPVNVTLCNTGNATFSITTTNAVSYQWQLNTGTGGWTDITDNGLYGGAATNVLTLTGANTAMDNYQYRCMASNSCGNIYSIAATLIVSTAVTPSVTIAATATDICQGTGVTFTATGTGMGMHPVFQWQKNGINTGTNNNSYTDNTLADGDVIQCLLTSDAPCLLTTLATSNPIILTVHAPVEPIVTIAPSVDNICYGTPVTFTATVTNGGVNPQFTWFKNATNLFFNSPVYTDNTLVPGDLILCVMRTSLSCVSAEVAVSNPVYINVTPLVTPSVTISATATQICMNTSVTFTASSINEGNSPVYEWRKNNQTVGNNSNTYTGNTFNDGDIITCQLTSNSNCLVSSQAISNEVKMKVYKNPVVELDHTSTLCEYEVRSLDAGNFTSYLWNTGESGRVIMVSDTGTYYVTVIDNNGCLGSDTTHILSILPAPAAFLPADTSICTYGDLLIKTNRAYNKYVWSNGAMSSSITVTQPGTYWLQVTDNNGCAGKDTINVIPKECLLGFFMPTGFTPNHDGKNDLLSPILLGDVVKYTFSVYNRWGQLVFQSSDWKQGWDGKYNGIDQPSAVFIWTCIYQFRGESQQYKKGTAVLIR